MADLIRTKSRSSAGGTGSSSGSGANSPAVGDGTARRAAGGQKRKDRPPPPTQTEPFSGTSTGGDKRARKQSPDPVSMAATAVVVEKSRSPAKDDDCSGLDEPAVKTEVGVRVGSKVDPTAVPRVEAGSRQSADERAAPAGKGAACTSWEFDASVDTEVKIFFPPTRQDNNRR